MYFPSAKKKIERAEYHILDLERQFAAFVAEKPHSFVIDTDAKTGQVSARIQLLKNPPDVLSLIIGDAIHNLRAALDHMAWDMAMYGRGVQDRYTSFPIGDSQVNFEASCKGIVTPCEWVKDAFRATEAFPEGLGDDLYYLNKMDNVDKHTFVSPVMKATSHPPFNIYLPDGSLGGKVHGNMLVGGLANRIPLVSLPKGHRIEVDTDGEFAISIYSEKARALAEPTVNMLKRFVVSVRMALHTLESALPDKLVI